MSTETLSLFSSALGSGRGLGGPNDNLLAAKPSARARARLTDLDRQLRAGRLDGACTELLRAGAARRDRLPPLAARLLKLTAEQLTRRQMADAEYARGEALAILGLGSRRHARVLLDEDTRLLHVWSPSAQAAYGRLEDRRAAGWDLCFPGGLGHPDPPTPLERDLAALPADAWYHAAAYEARPCLVCAAHVRTLSRARAQNAEVTRRLSASCRELLCDLLLSRAATGALLPDELPELARDAYAYSLNATLTAIIMPRQDQVLRDLLGPCRYFRFREDSGRRRLTGVLSERELRDEILPYLPFGTEHRQVSQQLGALVLMTDTYLRDYRG